MSVGSDGMGAVRFCTASLLRRRIAGMLAIAVLIGLAGSLTLAAFAGARRTDTAYPRLLDRVHALDVLVAPDFGETVSARDLAKLPGVAFAADAYGFGLSDWSGRGTRPPDANLGLGGFGLTLAGARSGAESPRVSEGRLPRNDRPGEMFANEAAAKTLGLHVGSTVHYSLYEFSDLVLEDGSMNPDAVFTPVTFEVVGIGTTVDDLLLNENQDTESLLLSPAFVRQYRDLASYKVAGVFLEHGTRDLASFTAGVNRIVGDQKVQLQTRTSRERAFEAVAEPYSASLLLFGIAATLAALIVVAQALARIVDLDATDGPALSALGASRRTRASIASGRALIGIAIGAVLAVVGAIALSPLFPLGRARDAEPDPGVHVDALALGAGFVAIVVLLAVPTLVRAWRVARRRMVDEAANAERPVRVAERLAASGAPASLVTGVRFAFRDGDGRRVSILTTLFGLVVAAATVIAALTFGTSLDRMIETPARYGWNWDALTDTYDSGATPELVAALRDDQRAAGLTVGTRGNVTFDGTSFSGYGLEHVRGHALPQASEGRMPQRATEVALGAETLRTLGKDVGDTVDATQSDGSVARLHIVGRTALPALALNGTDALGDGAALTAEGLARLDATAEPSFFLVDLAPGAKIAQLQRSYGDSSTTLGPQRPGAILTYGEVRRTPLLLAGLLGLLGAGVLVHLLVTSVRARRRDLAILKTIGFTRRQIATTVAAQATTLVLVALVIAIPLGIVIGRWTWSSFAGNLGVVAGVVVPTAAVLAVVAITLLIGNAAAAFPARSAARTRAALVLRSE
jgi:FtsX-like permease family